MKTIKQLLTTIAVLLCSVVANAHDLEIDGIYYNVISFTDFTVAVTYKGDKYDSFTNEYRGKIVIPSTVTYRSKILTVTSIEEKAFYNCDGLTSVTIGNGVTSIGEDAFSNCSSLTSVIIPNSVTSIGDGAFFACSGLTSVTIPNSVTSIGDNAFDNCRGLTSVTIPESVTSIGYGAFWSCTSLTSITIGNSVTTIGVNAFTGCSGLTSVTIGNGVTSIGYGAFGRCDGLKEVHINDIAAWCNISFESYDSNPLYYAKNLYLNGELVKDLVIPNSVTSIGREAFWGCDLESVTLNFNSIGSWFSGKTSIKKFVIGDNVKSIEEKAFKDCSGLISIYLLGTTPPTVEYGNFTKNQYMDLTVYVPKGSLATYQAADTWKTFWDIQEFDVTAIENVEDVTPAFEITSSGIQFTAADGKAIAIYAPNGALVEKIDAYAGEAIVLDKGVYVVCVGNKTIKIKL